MVSLRIRQIAKVVFFWLVTFVLVSSLSTKVNELFFQEFFLGWNGRSESTFEERLRVTARAGFSLSGTCEDSSWLLPLGKCKLIFFSMIMMYYCLIMLINMFFLTKPLLWCPVERSTVSFILSVGPLRMRVMVGWVRGGGFISSRLVRSTSVPSVIISKLHVPTHHHLITGRFSHFAACFVFLFFTLS